MPIVYQLECAACGRRTISAGHLALRLDSGEFVPLPHPAESSRLREFGLTPHRWSSANCKAESSPNGAP